MILAVNYENVPYVKRASFKLPFGINLEKLGKFLKSKNMEIKIKNGMLTARTNETYIYVSRQGHVSVYSFKRIRSSYLCKRIAGFKVG